jgi:SAM-dependent methyltransferase
MSPAYDRAYDRDYYRTLDATSLRSARRVVPRVLELVAPRRVVDVGCGRGSWLSVFLEHGVPEVLGVDGDWVDPASLHIPADRFRRVDLGRPLEVEGDFDLAVCLEVAEHLPEDRAPGLAADLARLAPVVLFSAAVPFQGGVEHVNEQWPDYWAERFAGLGFRAVDILRRELWDDPEVVWWYAQNTLLFVREDRLAGLPRLLEAVNPTPPRLIHPRHYLIKIEALRNRSEPERMSLKTLLVQIPRVATHALGRRLRRGSPKP